MMDNKPEFKHLFGPVPSRRLGLSLGVDLVPLKTCNLNCVYCECGRTTCLTNKRESYVDAEEIIRELSCYLKKKRKIDYITFSGGGEPLLNSEIGRIISFVKKNFPQYKLALLTNGILLSEKSVVEEIKKIDLIVPSLDAGTAETFYSINRPCSGVIFEDFLDGLKNFTFNSESSVWLEIFLIKGMNDFDDELSALKKIAESVRCDKIQLNTVDRPTAEVGIEGVSYEKMLEIKKFFGEKAEIIGKFAGKSFSDSNSLGLIANCLERRPLTLDDIMEITCLHINEVNKILSVLENENRLEIWEGERGIFYKLKK